MLKGSVYPRGLLTDKHAYAIKMRLQAGQVFENNDMKPAAAVMYQHAAQYVPQDWYVKSFDRAGNFELFQAEKQQF